jgi:glycosyltransferase involved in cell wall biosynthesis
MKEPEILSIHYDDAHPVHKAWFEEVGDVQRLEIDNEPSWTNIFRYLWKAKEVSSEYDAIICEGKVGLRTALVKKIFNPNLKLIRLVADQGLYECSEGLKSDIEEKITHRFVDGAIANSEFMKKYAEDYINGSVKVVHPFIPDLEKFRSMKKDYQETKEICFVGYNYPNKNIDALIEAVKDTEYTLHIVGEGHEERDAENIKVHGYVENLEDIFSKCDLYVQPSRGDAFGVAPAEAIAAGIPAIVTESTGLKEFIEPARENMTSGSSSEELLETIENFYEIEEGERARIAGNLSDIIQVLTEENSRNDFSQEVSKII